MMNDDMEELLGRLTPRGVRADLRPQVLAAVASHLKAERASPWLMRSTLVVAALLLLGIGMNLGVSERAERRLAEIYGPPAVSKRAMELAKAVEEVTDAQTAQWVYRQFAAPPPRGDGLAAYAAYSDMLRRLLNTKEPFDETPQEDSQVERDRPGRPAGDRSDCQRYLRLDHRCTA